MEGGDGGGDCGDHGGHDACGDGGHFGGEGGYAFFVDEGIGSAGLLSRPKPQIRGVAGLTLAVIVCIGLSIGALILAVVYRWHLAQTESGSDAFREAYGRADGARYVEGWIGTATIVAFAVWIYRAHRNAASFEGTPFRSSPALAVAYLFIPVANLWLPFQTLSELWRASDDPQNWPKAPTPKVVVVWGFLWFVAIVSTFVANANGSGSLRGGLPVFEDFAFAQRYALFAEAVSIMSCFVSAIVVWRIGRMQSRRIVKASIASRIS
jgi:hypothetical protein